MPTATTASTNFAVRCSDLRGGKNFAEVVVRNQPSAKTDDTVHRSSDVSIKLDLVLQPDGILDLSSQSYEHKFVSEQQVHTN